MSVVTVGASAPGKLMLLGEYAVLDGATALVAAVDRRARVTVRGSIDGRVHVVAPDLGIDVAGRLTSHGTVRWEADAATAGRLRLVATAIEAVATSAGTAGRGPGFDATVSTAAFFGATGVKLGLGSSAALTVALAAALRDLIGLSPPHLADLVRTHRAAQGGRGSGADVAAALSGGVIAYSADPPTAVPAELPAGVHWCCVFTGRSTSTASFLHTLGAWRRRNQENAADYRARLAELTATSAAGTDAARRGDASSLLNSIGAYGSLLDGLGAASGIDIVGAEHRRIRNAAATCGVTYKPSGAGGGDIGVGFARDAGHIEEFRHAVTRLGYATVDVAVDPRGLTMDIGETE